MKKKIFLIVLLFCFFHLNVNALENVNLNITTEFNENVPFEKIKSVCLVLLDSNSHEHFFEVFDYNDYKTTINDFSGGEIKILYLGVRDDYIYQYPVMYTVEYTENDINVKLTVSERSLKNIDINEITYDEEYYKILLGDKYEEAKEAIEKELDNINSTTTVPIIDNSNSNENVINKEVDENIQDNNEESINDNRVIHLIVFGSLGFIIVIGGIIVTKNIINANK